MPPPSQCHSCGQWAVPNAPFCSQCGTPLPQTAAARSGCGPAIFGSVFGCAGLLVVLTLIVGAVIVALMLGLLQSCNQAPR